MNEVIRLPQALEPYREALLAMRVPYIRVLSQAQAAASPWQSKTGGMPYLPKGMEWPVSKENNTPLFFLTQLNFAEMPALDPFPRKGILQFFIGDDDLYGMNFDDGEDQVNFRVLYHPDPINDPSALQDLPELVEREFGDLPHHPDECYPLRFELAEMLLPATDYRFNERFGADFFARFGADEWDVLDEYAKSVDAQGHRVGGYAYFTQDDPRTPSDPMLLLFQLDSDQVMDLMWSDMGVGHFFIREQDLKDLRFDRVLYDWDAL
ncbi:MAG: YwqG family protein [Saprospiraceae bacterium]